MGKVLRGYQIELKQGCYDAWNKGARNVMAVTATGSGKTVTMATMAQELGGLGIIQAHRAELVGQISTAMGAEGLRHNIIGSAKTVRAVVETHMKKIGRSMYDPRARWSVASVDTLLRRGHPQAEKMDWVFTDEGHHVLADNKWGRALQLFPSARGLLMTATPTRADGKGLGAHHDGLVHSMVVGPGLGDLIRWGYLVNYEVCRAKAEDLDMSDVHVGPSGELVQAEVSRAFKRSKKIVGDIVKAYRQYAEHLHGGSIVFAVDREEAQKITDAFNAAGIAAEFLHGEHDEDTRRSVLGRFEDRQLRVLVNVDLFGEGLDVPSVACVIMARPTASFALYAQMIGRMLRLDISPILMAAWDTYSIAERHAHVAASRKPNAVLIDLVGNTLSKFKIGDGEHGPLLPEAFTQWSLDRRGRRRASNSGGIPLRICEGCYQPYERVCDACPYCGHGAPEPAGRSTPEQVDGDVTKLSPEVLAALRGEAARAGGEVPFHTPRGLPEDAVRAAHHAHQEKVRAQFNLRGLIDLWAGHYPKDTNAENYRRFFFKFGMDVLSAMTLNAAESAKLESKLHDDIAKRRAELAG